MSVTTISPQQLADLCKPGRSTSSTCGRRWNFEKSTPLFARNVPLDKLDPAAIMQARNGSKDEPLYLICRSGSRGRQACEKFLAAGFTNVVNIEGGTLAASKPVCRSSVARRRFRWNARSELPRGRWSAGAAVVRPSGLHRAVGIRGGGSGVRRDTDTCGMGMMLARMPWNQVSGAARACCGKKEVCS